MGLNLRSWAQVTLLAILIVMALVAGRQFSEASRKRRDRARTRVRWLCREEAPRGNMRPNRRSWAQVILLVGIIVMALLAGWQFSEASGTWQDAVRRELRQALTVQEKVRRVYGEEAPLAFEVAVAETQVAELRTVRTTGRLAMSEHTIATKLQDLLRARAEAGSPIAAPAYARGELGYDVLRRLADDLATVPPVDPGRARETADLHAAFGTAAAGAGIGLAVLAAILGLSARRRPRGEGIEVIPQPTASAPSQRGPAALTLASWVLLAVLPLSQLVLASEEQRRQADAAVSAVRLSTAIFVSNQRNAFLAASRQAVLSAETKALARQFATFDGSAPAVPSGEREVAEVETQVAQRMKRLAEVMGGPASDGTGLDHAVVAALNSGPGDWPAALAEQNRQVDRAEQASDRGLRVIISTALAGLAGPLAAATAARPVRRRRGHTAGTIVLLATAVAVAVSGAWA